MSTLKKTSENARTNGVTAAPTFEIEGYGRLTGAQPVATFRAIIAEIEKRSQQ